MSIARLNIEQNNPLVTLGLLKLCIDNKLHGTYSLLHSRSLDYIIVNKKDPDTMLATDRSS